MRVHIPSFVQIVLDQLDIAVRSKLSEIFEIIKLGDHHQLMSYGKKVDEHLYELKIKTVIHVRILFTFYDGQMFLIHAFTKKTWKIPKRELETATTRLKRLRNL